MFLLVFLNTVCSIEAELRRCHIIYPHCLLTHISASPTLPRTSSPVVQNSTTAPTGDESMLNRLVLGRLLSDSKTDTKLTAASRRQRTRSSRRQLTDKFRVLTIVSYADV